MWIRWNRIRIRIRIRNTAWRSAMSSTDVTRPDTVCFSARRTTPPPPRVVTKFRVRLFVRKAKFENSLVTCIAENKKASFIFLSYIMLCVYSVSILTCIAKKNASYIMLVVALHSSNLFCHDFSVISRGLFDSGRRSKKKKFRKVTPPTTLRFARKK
jgi:hypothetical protein